MSCLVCKRSQPEYTFNVLEIHTLHIRDFSGERLVQAVGESKSYEVCAACVSSEMQAVLYPARRILRGCLGFVLLIAAGLVLSLARRLEGEVWAVRVLGPMAVVVGVIGAVGKVRTVLRERRELEALGREERERVCAWRCLTKNAPHKHGDNDLTYIPVDEACSLSEKELAVQYDLLPPIARKVYELINKE